MSGWLPVVFLAVVCASVDSRPAESELKLTFSPNLDFPDRYFKMTLESHLQFGEDAQWFVENEDGTQQAIHGTRIPGSTNMVFPQVPCAFYEGAIVLRYSGREFKNQDIERGKACGKDDDNSASMCKASAILIVSSMYLLREIV